MQSREYRYGGFPRIFLYLAMLVWGSVSLFAILMMIINWVRWIVGNLPANVNIIEASIILLIIPTVTCFMAGTIANLKPNVRVSDKGLAIQNLLIWWYLIPWEDVRDIRPIPLFGSRVRLVVARKLPLSLTYRWIGTIYFAFFQPAFLISSEIDDYDELIHIIKKKIGKELWE